MSAAAAAQLGAGGAGAAGSGGGGAGVAEGPGLARGAGEDALVSSLNEWGRRVDASLGLLMSSFSDLRGEVFGNPKTLTIKPPPLTLNLGIPKLKTQGPRDQTQKRRPIKTTSCARLLCSAVLLSVSLSLSLSLCLSLSLFISLPL
jgi:hypothetical protein